MAAEGQPLVCPLCGREYPSSERFCAQCQMPLVHRPAAGGACEEPAGELRRRARKIKPQYSEGPLVKVAQAENQVEAEFLAGLLLEEGIPSVLRSSIAGYAPLIGSREVLVPASGVQAAREALRAPDRDGADPRGTRQDGER